MVTQRPLIYLKSAQQMRAGVVAFLPQIPSRVFNRTYEMKKRTGRHCTQAALQKYTRELFTETYKISFESLPVKYQGEIIKTVSDAYYGMKEARVHE